MTTEETETEIEEITPVFELEMTVSSDTYVRSIAHGLAIAVGSAVRVVSLTRTRQDHSSHRYTPQRRVKMSNGRLLVPSPRKRSTVDWAVLEGALRKLEVGEETAVDVDGWATWGLEILRGS